MDLSSCYIRRTRCNSLWSAVHRDHGLAWTDGTNIYLSPLSVISGLVENTQPTKLGEFSDVEHVHWSCDVISSHDQTTSCFLSVVHKEAVTLWMVTGVTPNLSFKQVRKIHMSPITQGCLWHPSRDLLCLCSRDKISLYFNHNNGKGSYALPDIDSGHVTCGCWSKDGKKLVIAVATSVQIYEWDDMQTVSDYTTKTWAIPGVSGRICCMSPCKADQFLCTVELPLDQICASQENLFHIPDLSLFDGNSPSNSLTRSKVIEETGSEVTDTRSETTRSNVTEMTTDLDELESNSSVIDLTKSRCTSHKDSLFNLKASVQQAPQQDCSLLVLFDLSDTTQEPRKLAVQGIHNILSPDLLCQTGTSTVVVGSNSQNKLYVYTISENSLNQSHVLHLGDSERPLGLCTGPDQHSVLTMVTAGRQDNTFLPTSLYTKCDVTVMCMHIPGESMRSYIQNPQDIPNTKMFREIQLPNGNSKVHLLRISPLRNQPSQEEQVNMNTSEGDTSMEQKKENINSVKSNNSASFSIKDKVLKSLDKLSNRTNSDKSPPKRSKSTGSDSESSRSESPEFKLVLPNSNELTLHNDHVRAPKVMVINGGEGDNTRRTGLETERIDFNEKTVRFKNKVKKFFESNSSSKDDVTEQTGSEDAGSENAGSTVSANTGSSSCIGVKTSGAKSRSVFYTEESGDHIYCASSNINQGSVVVQSSSSSEYSSLRSVQDHREMLEQLHKQKEEICSLHSRLDELKKPQEKNLKPILHYPTLDNAKTVTMVYHLDTDRPMATRHSTQSIATDGEGDYISMTTSAIVSMETGLDSGLVTKKSFLLDDGRLKLDLIKSVFKLTMVEISIGGMYCAVGENCEGYLPLTFQPGQTIHITGT